MSRRSAAARDWAVLLSELSGVAVSLEWERPSWIVAWADGPTVGMLRARAEALAEHGVLAGLSPGELGWRRWCSPTAWAWGYLWAAARILGEATDEGPGEVGRWEREASIEALLERVAYPERLGVGAGGTVSVAQLLVRLAGGDTGRMQTLLEQAQIADLVLPVPDAAPVLAGAVTSFSWPGRPQLDALLGQAPEDERPTAPTGPESGLSETERNETCQVCGRALRATSTGRPGTYCSATCRSRAYRARHGTRS